MLFSPNITEHIYIILYCNAAHAWQDMSRQPQKLVTSFFIGGVAKVSLQTCCLAPRSK